jgi:glycosyltransferase involved in cell wall biosynthesis
MDSVAPGGGVRVIFDQARALNRKGNKVKIRTLGGDPQWYPYPVDVDLVERLDQPFKEDAIPDVVIATYWTTVEPAISIGAPVVLHLCQGFEADFPELAENHSAIMEAYLRPIPKLTVGPWLADRLETVFGTKSFSIYVIGQCVDTALYKPGKLSIKWYFPKFLRLRMPWNILVIGDYAISCKGVSDSLQAVGVLRKMLPRVCLTRISMHPRNEEENKITRVNFSFVRVPPGDMAKFYQRADFMISMSLPSEGFGLPAAEAMACGCPVVLTRIPSYLSFDQSNDYATFVDIHDSEEAAASIFNLVSNRALCFNQRHAALKMVRKNFCADNVADHIEKIIYEQRQ